MVTVVKPSAKPRRARLLSKGRKLNNKKRGRPKKAALSTEKKNKKNQSALDLLHAKTLSAAPPQGQNRFKKYWIVMLSYNGEAISNLNWSISLLSHTEEMACFFTSYGLETSIEI